MKTAKVAIVHDDLVQWGGAERVLAGICELFPDAPIYTSVFDSSNKLLASEFKNREIVTSFIQNIPGWRLSYKALLPLYPIAFEQFDFTGFDLVVSHTTRFAKSVITKPETPHICYCHTPPRFLWNFSGEGVPAVAKPYLSYLRYYDQISSKRVDRWVAGSDNARGRIKRVYREDALICHPFVDLSRFKDVDSFDGGYYLIVARLNKYKRVDIAVEASRRTDRRLKIVGVGPESPNLKEASAGHGNIELMGEVGEGLLINLLAGCRGLIVTAEEDFGLTSLEAQALGKGIIAFGEGGSRESIVANRTGVFFNNQTAEELSQALDEFEGGKFMPDDCKENAGRFSKERFQRRFLDIVKMTKET